MESGENNGQAECISESHLQFMRDYVAREEKLAKATVEAWLQLKVQQAEQYC